MGKWNEILENSQEPLNQRYLMAKISIRICRPWPFNKFILVN